MFKGSMTALITPFKQGKIDEEAFRRFIDFQIKSGTDALVVCGTTGESATLTDEEQSLATQICLSQTKKRVPVIVGTGCNDTQKTIAKTLSAQKAGADAALIVTPYYNKPSQKGLYEHYKAVHDATDLPIFLYNVPGRTGIDISVSTVESLAKLPRIIGIKEASADLSKVLKLRVAVGDDFLLFSGEDATVAAFLAQGGNGCISVTANIAPKECALLHRAWREKDMSEFSRLRDLLLPLHVAMFVESNPSPAKYAASLMGFGDGTIRLPLWEISDESKDIVRSAMKTVGVLF